MPLSMPARDLVVTWGGSTLDENAGVALNSWDSSYRTELSYFQLVFACEITLRVAAPTGNRATDEAAFAALQAALYTTFTAPRQHLTVKLAGTTIHDWDPTPGVYTAFQLYATLSKIGKNTDTGLSCRYRWEVRAGRPADLSGQGFRQSSNTATTYTINGRRVCVISAVYTAGGGLSGLANYNASGGMDFFCSQNLPAAVSGGEWIKQEDTPPYEDENSVVTGRRVFWEVINGLRDFTVSASYSEAQLVSVTIAGTYTKCLAFASAFGAYRADIQARASAILGTFTGDNFNTWSQPDVRTDVQTATDEIFNFSRTYRQIAGAQGPGGPHDPNVGGGYRLDVKVSDNWSQQTGGTQRVRRLRFASVDYQAAIDFTSSGGQDPYQLWLTKFRQHCLAQLALRMQASQIMVLHETPGVGLERNQLYAHLDVLVIGGAVLELHIRERIRVTAAKRRIPRADGTAFSYKLMARPPEKILTRRVSAEYVAGQIPSAFLNPGEQDSGYAFTNTGTDIFSDLQYQTQPNYSPPVPGWMGDYGDTDYSPSSRGPNDELQTVVVEHVEQWTYVAALETGAAGAGSGATVG